MSTAAAPQNNDFASSVLHGLSDDPKWLSSKFLYDSKGDDLFMQIMDLKEYYPYRCEEEILTLYKDRILSSMQREIFSLVELGAGDGKKTRILLNHFQKNKAQFIYMPVDISSHVIDLLCNALKNEMPGLQVKGVTSDFIAALTDIKKIGGRKLVLFLGATIGNIPRQQVTSFLSMVAGHLTSGDRMLIGFDLRKDPRVIYRAYYDSEGVTTQFTMNILDRINRELGGNFNRSAFMHYPVYDPATGEMKSFIVSRVRQTVHVEALNKDFFFTEWEPIFTEVSNKYSISEINDMAASAGMTVNNLFSDRNGYFIDALLTKN
jgi:L-histidine Nalpha-methyltransferase